MTARQAAGSSSERLSARQLHGASLAPPWLAYVTAVSVTIATFVHALPLWLAETAAQQAARSPQLETLVGIDFAIGLCVPVACAGVAALIAVRRPRDLYALFSSLEILLFGCLIAGTLSVAPLDQWSLPTRVVRSVGELAVLVQLCVFPSGRFALRWTAVMCAVFAIWMVAALVDPSVDHITARGLWQLVLAGFFVAAMCALVYRFARRASQIERLQMKWGALGSALVIAAYALWSVLRILGGAEVVVTGADILVGLTSIVFALMYAFAILRYRLYDVDVLINRALVYGATSAGIAVAFFAVIILLEALLRPITSGSELALVASTLACFALFQPLRRTIQVGVDRRFYRSRYDAGRTLEAFRAQLRDEVDLEAVRADLVDAVERTVQPRHASVWLRKSRQ